MAIAYVRTLCLLAVSAGLIHAGWGRGAEQPAPAAARPSKESAAGPACRVKSIKRAPDGLRPLSPDGKQYVVSRKDAQGIYQVYVGKTAGGLPDCISSAQRPGSPKPDRHKVWVDWHPSGKWIFVAAEWDEGPKPYFAKRGFPGMAKLTEGWLQCGLWLNVYLARPDGSRWYRLTDFGPEPKPGGFTGIAFTPDGKKAVWAQIVDGNVLKYTFGKWELILAELHEDRDGVPSFTNLKNITPAGAHWLEPGNFSPDGKSLLLSADIGLPDPAHVEGMDQYILDITTGKVTNLTNSPGIWDEHGVFSPDGEKVLFMSSYPYRNDPRAHHVLGLKTEFMLINKDGSGLQQITHFNQPGYPEYSKRTAVAANGLWSRDGSSVDVLSLFFPEYETWTIQFEGPCGRAKGGGKGR